MFKFTRLVRTACSECHVIWDSTPDDSGSTRVRLLDIHFQGRYVHGTLVLEVELTEESLDSLLGEIDERIIGHDREDYIFTVYLGRELGYYSDPVSAEDRAEYGASRKDLAGIEASLAKVIGRHQAARGKLAEHALVEYFSKLGYYAERAGAELDAKKVDVVARSASELIYAQSKAGAISKSEMRAVAKNIAQMPNEPPLSKVAAIVAREFPFDSETQRRTLENELGIAIICIQQYQVLAASPEYRLPLSGDA